MPSSRVTALYWVEKAPSGLKIIRYENCFIIPVMGVFPLSTAISLRSGKYSADGSPASVSPE